jgi:8-oxo-dGTP diphosphatase
MTFRFCPHCGSGLTYFDHRGTQRQRCEECGFVRYRNPTVGVAVILLRDHRLLLTQRRCGRWCIPCGHVEWTEDVEAAARRELQEETGLTCELLRVYAVQSNFHDLTSHTVGVWYLGQEMGGSLSAGDDAMQAKFFALTNIPELAFPTDKTVIDQLASELNCGPVASAQKQ